MDEKRVFNGFASVLTGLVLLVILGLGVYELVFSREWFSGGGKTGISFFVISYSKSVFSNAYGFLKEVASFIFQTFLN